MSRYREVNHYEALEYVFNRYQMVGKACDDLIPIMLQALGYYDGKEKEQPSQVDERSTDSSLGYS